MSTRPSDGTARRSGSCPPCRPAPSSTTSSTTTPTRASSTSSSRRTRRSDDVPKILTEAQVQAFQRDGFLSPVRAMSAQRARHYRERFESLETRAPDIKKMKTKSHLLCPWVLDIAEDPYVLDIFEDLIGPNTRRRPSLGPRGPRGAAHRPHRRDHRRRRVARASRRGRARCSSLLRRRHTCPPSSGLSA